MEFLTYQPAAIQLGWTFYLPLFGLVAMIALGVPVWVAIGLGSLTIITLTEALPLSVFGASLFEGINAFALIAVPLFILTGDALVRSGLSDKLLDLAQATVGGFRTGLGSSTTLGCGFFACISGSDAAGAAAVGRMTIHRLVERGYPLPAACALVASGACTGILIPPSIAYIVIGLVLGMPVSTLFLAAAIPGVLVMLSVMLTNVMLNRLHGFEKGHSSFSFKVWLRAVWDARWALFVPFVILGGIYSGIFTPTEAASVAVVVVVLVGMQQGTLTLGDIPKMLESSARVCGVIVPIIAVAHPLAQLFSSLAIPQTMVGGITSLTDSPVLIILLMIGILVLAGCVMEATPNIVILAPLLLPLAQMVGMNDIHFAILMVTTLGMGFITPPLGLNLFVVAGLTRCSILAIARYAVPFVLGMLMVALLIAFVPWLSLWWR
ncbi:TRAP transporter large permease [Halomonas sp. MCCC 1A17488]|uniref:TRAP transporter large permease n=1 Tax=unclassified Halomonas TaxID=2609666 RepID=UPI0018D22906|nr:MULTISPECIES: TRAP transporter large permease [unclassified Halomonas]MCE8017653.1 TRAP transporter large permease [Halomonas sp. MCCC 1A17488]MCG3240986.1 TRAP transporter large permease [Halomonas sp. MCCC 1A17488]QPP48854.1 TRAP transporter large permease [Halomonas sp. SS10-MC5]